MLKNSAWLHLMSDTRRLSLLVLGSVGLQSWLGCYPCAQGLLSGLGRETSESITINIIVLECC